MTRPRTKRPRTPPKPRTAAPPPSARPPLEIYPLLVDSLREGVFTVDPGFRITSFNTEAERITGLGRETAIGRHCYDVFRTSICQRECALKTTLRTGEPLRDVRIDVLDASMRQVPISVSTAVLRDAKGTMVGGVELFRDISDLEALRHELAGHTAFRNMIGASEPMQALFRMLPDVAASEAPVLIEGPSGTGKELVAQAIHDLGPRREKPFVRVNCGAFPDTLLESELFGFVRGAFTDARRDKPGRFVLADKGTILLDEIGDVTPAFQVKLLRVLQEGEVQPLGSTSTVKVDVRVLAATNKDLAAMVREGRFREDLYYRIRVVPVVLPPLRERRADIPLLVQHAIERLALRTGKAIRTVSPTALRHLYDYDYPGNVRELLNLVERAFVLCHGPTIDVAHLPPEVVRGTRDTRPPLRHASLRPSERALLDADPADRSVPVDRPEARKLLQLLQAHGWNRTRTAEALGIGRNTLWRRMKDYGLLD